MTEERALAGYFDGWYADMVVSPRKAEIAQRHLGLPPHLLSTSLLSCDGLGEVVEALRLSAGATLLDLARGRGGSGLEVARRTGAGVVGVDFSAEAVRQATAHARRLDWQADFRVGTLSRTRLDDAAVDAVALTCWEAVDRDDDRVPQRLRQVDLRTGLSAA